jgi:hypothetical protein
LDHTEHPGSSVEEIAREKLASLRPGTRLILGTEDPNVVEVALQACEEVGADLVEVVERSGYLATVAEDLAPYLAHNVRVGIRAAETLLGRSLDEAESRGALATRLPGRFAVRHTGDVLVIVDGGHNAAGVEAAVEAARNAYGERPLGVEFGALRDKDIGSMLAVLQKDADMLVLTKPKGERAADPSWVDEVIRPVDGGGSRARVRADVDVYDAVEDAVAEMAGCGGAVLVTGSLQTAAGIWVPAHVRARASPVLGPVFPDLNEASLTHEPSGEPGQQTSPPCAKLGIPSLVPFSGRRKGRSARTILERVADRRSLVRGRAHERLLERPRTQGPGRGGCAASPGGRSRATSASP